jgi:hypothetical protein
VSHKKYKSEAAKKIAASKPARPVARDSKKFKDGSSPHQGGSRGQSGQPRR